MSKTTPKLGVAYPLHIGKSLRGGSRGGSRRLLSLKFTDMPKHAALTQPGSLTCAADKCTVELSTTDGQGVEFTGSRRRDAGSVGDYALVFAAGAMWMEAAADVFFASRPTPVDRRAPVPPRMHDDVGADPDTWMAQQSGSPITPDAEEGEEDQRGMRPVSHSKVGGKSVAAKTLPVHVPSKNHDNRSVSSSDDDEDSDSDDSDSDSDSAEYTDNSSDDD